ncbi:DASS family sodium-coupled anion symporter [Fulvivirga aurantia]|uniref:SLC13 family permease n=1 Tax=Fulvivirga aurantia TaxID=2529383 RepID=UPI0031B5DE31
MGKKVDISKVIGLFIGPLLFALLLLLFRNSPEYPLFCVLAVASWMITWWVTEAIPIPATSLLPIVLLPLLGIFKVSEATAPYASSIIFLFMGGFLIALALEKHNLHKRIALNLLRLTGSSGNGIILGFMAATALLSMWISNTATAVMMLPIALSVANLLLKKDTEKLTRSEKNFSLGLMLSIAYAANIGGSMTLIGTPPNVVMAGYLTEILDYTMTFSSWFGIGLPVGFLLLTITYLLITKLLFKNNLKKITGSEQLVNSELQKLGKISKSEKLVLTIFAITAFGWIFKQQINQLIGEPLLSDTVTAMAGGLLMFITPVHLKKNKFILKWEDTKKLPWGILLLFGGGMCLARAMEKVGIIQLMGEFVKGQGELPTTLIVLITTAMVLFLTELMSNVALITIFIPVAIGIAQGLGINPLLLVIPATIASSCAFMMPISTPPNAIVFSSGYIKMKQMIRAGFLLNLIAIAVLVLLNMLLIEKIF